MAVDKSTETVFETPWFGIEREYFDNDKSLNGEPFYRLLIPDGVMVLALTGDDEIVMVKQFRPALKQVTMELPAGYLEKDEDPRDAAIRELYEETGFRCDEMQPLGPGRVMMSRCSAVQHSFVGIGATLDSGFHPQEDIEVVLEPPSKLPELFNAGEFQSLSGFGLLTLAALKYDIQLMDNRI
jgi:ADP-ribose pyrophosphatase